MNSAQAYWAIIPAAGLGRRMGSSVPKQFLAIGNKTVLEHCLESLWKLPELSGMVLVSHGHPALACIQERFRNQRLLRADARGRDIPERMTGWRQAVVTDDLLALIRENSNRQRPRSSAG